ncbi:hypothetical protein [Nostoc sp. JL33]|uniref:hypothetical protein n=1 Tax=Nostoc sp. JL33 TaxID=2815396 RepID=UPI0025D95B46|nr:hypothetical protein [Nostoc sp. JL33]MBN3873118.1 hypothetical protein [Nostoc sp. JL33]
MIAQHYNLIHVENNLLKQIKIKENQLKIAQESNLLYVAEGLQNELLKLQCQLSEPLDSEPLDSEPLDSESEDVEIQALMSLLDD